MYYYDIFHLTPSNLIMFILINDSRNEPDSSTLPSSPPLLQPTRLADYIETFNELQSRLSQALGSPEKDLNIDTTVIRRVIN